MTRKHSTFLRALMLALAVQFSLAGAADAACFSPKQTKKAIKRGEAVPLSTALRREDIRGRVVKAQLCSGPVYNVTILLPSGALQRFSISAR